MNRFLLARKATPALSVLLLAALAACGGGSGTDAVALTAAADRADAASAAATEVTSASATNVAPAAAADAASEQASNPEALDSGVASAMASTEVAPAYHMAPVLLDEPESDDAGGTNNSARLAPKTWQSDAALADLPTSRLSRDALIKRIAEMGRMRTASASSETTAPAAVTLKGTVFTPAQIRAAYGLAALPAVGASLTTAQAAELGAGQTIYVVDAYHDATALSDLNAFSAKFGLPTCTNVAVAVTAPKLATAPSYCTFSQVHSTLTSAMTATVPAYNGTWAPESKLDVQWAHAIAPLARIVLVEMPDSMSSSILGASLLAKRLGAGVVSMSFGSVEAGWASSVDAYFAGTGMTYVAAAGDSGAQVLWPAVSPSVLAVGGTGMNWSGNTRTEVAWLHSGGGMSSKVALPAYQSGVRPAGGGTLARRAVPDVAFNANPSTGQYVAVTLPGAGTVWSAYGGTSIAAPQWAGIVAVANAIRAANAKAALGDIHTLLYKSIAPVPGTYAAALGDVTQGTNGTCATCTAGAGFDMATGWGTPNSAGLFSALTGVASTPTKPAASTNHAPTLAAGSFTAKAGTKFEAVVKGSDADGDALSYWVAGQPAGVQMTASGTLYWLSAAKGTYKFTVTARDAKGATATGAITLVVS